MDFFSLADLTKTTGSHEAALRHPEVWLLCSLEIVYAQIEEIKGRNLQMAIPLGPEHFCEFMRELSDNEELTPSEVETKAQVMDLYKQEFTIYPEDRTPFADCIMTFAEEQLLDFEAWELEIMERERSMSSVYTMLNEKRLSRHANDGGVQYGRGWSPELREQTREYFDRLGGINRAGRSAPMKTRPGQRRYSQPIVPGE